METTVAQAWQKSKLFFKALLIGILVLLLLIPAYFVEELIKEREQRQKDAYEEVSSKWAGSQIITGPVLVLPYAETVANVSGPPTILRKQAYLLPDKLTITGDMAPGYLPGDALFFHPEYLREVQRNTAEATADRCIQCFVE